MATRSTGTPPTPARERATRAVAPLVDIYETDKGFVPAARPGLRRPG